MTSFATTRRKVLKNLLSISLFACAGRAATAASARARTPEQALAERCVATLRPADSAARIGRRYLQLAPREADLSALVARVAGGRVEALLRARGPVLRETLRARQEADFAVGDVVDLDGWVLSATEARLYALAALRA